MADEHKHPESQSRMVKCVKLGRLLPGVTRKPLSNEQIGRAHV